MKKLICFLIVLTLISVSCMTTRACSIPVFYYALSRWQSDMHLLTFSDAASAQDKKALRDLLDHSSANISENPSAKPVTRGNVRICFPRSEVAWWDAPLPGPDAKQGLLQLIDSPVRQNLARQIASGQAVVWLLLESGDKTQDEAAMAQISNRLRYLEKNTELPRPDGSAGPAESGPANLKVAFSVLRVKRGDPREVGLVAQLLHLEKDLNKVKTPIAFAVFGRARVLDPVYGKSLNDSVIDQTCQFAVGSCSCEVKAMNPGMDLLLCADWENLMQNPGQPEGKTSTSSAPELEVIKPQKKTNP